MMNTDVVVLTHVNMKLTEMEEANKQLEAEVESENEKISRVWKLHFSFFIIIVKLFLWVSNK